MMEIGDANTLTESLSQAEQSIQERLIKNLEMYHDLQKLQKKPHSEFTAQDLHFVRETICKDGICLGSALSGLS